MYNETVNLPSNQKFGFFFSGIFIITSSYFYLNENLIVAYSLNFLCILFLIVTIFMSKILLPLNKLWMRFGILLGLIVSPIILGVIFFSLFTPMSIIMLLFGRDELRLRNNKKNSYWIFCDTTKHQLQSFKNQF